MILNIDINQSAGTNEQVTSIRGVPDDTTLCNHALCWSGSPAENVWRLSFNSRSILIQNRFRYGTATQNTPLIIALRDRDRRAVVGQTVGIGDLPQWIENIEQRTECRRRSRRLIACRQETGIDLGHPALCRKGGEDLTAKRGGCAESGCEELLSAVIIVDIQQGSLCDKRLRAEAPDVVVNFPVRRDVRVEWVDRVVVNNKVYDPVARKRNGRAP